MYQNLAEIKYNNSTVFADVFSCLYEALKIYTQNKISIFNLLNIKLIL